jgi:hypothetical protein
MARDTSRSASEELVRAFERNPVFGYMHPYELYRKWLEAVWAFLDAVRDPPGFRQCLDRYSRAEGEEFGRLLGIYTDAVEADPFRDILGRLFMRLDVNSAHSGQYFTPWDVAIAMARMTFDRTEFERLVEAKGAVTVCDPAVGSGVMLLSYATVVYDEFGRWGTSKLRLYGQDIDMRCVHMCRIQIRMNGLDAFGRMAGWLASTQQDAPADSVILPAGRQLELPGVAA